MTIFLLCDILKNADFGRINLKNLQKIQKLDISGDDFSRASGVKPPSKSNISMRIHDQITHKKIKPSVLKYKGNETFIPLNKGIDNEDIEIIADRIEGRVYGNPNSRLNTIGKALRKRTLSQPEKLATNQRDSFLVDDLISTKRQPTNEDVKSLIDSIKSSPSVINKKSSRFPQKQRGSKPAQPTIEEKKQKLAQKYGIS